jgi:tRNA-Thr(GGU) m(6)t(6)A37 methyltransferase TsaA
MEVKPIAYVNNPRTAIEDDNWGAVISEITLTDEFSADAIAGIDQFSHLEIIFYFDQVTDEKIKTGARHPRNNKDWPLTGIFAQRGKNRPNKLGLCTCEVIGQNGKTVTVKGLDAINGTPVLDIKPVMKEFQPKGKVKQPEWATELMKNYW